jgi:threonine dehydrogenase-like Zn-dependent dehydrogenase
VPVVIINELAAILFMIDYVLFGVAMIRTAALPRWSGLLVAVGAPAHLLGFGIAQLVSTAAWPVAILGSVCLGAGLGWASCRLWQTPTAADRNRTSGRHGVAVGCLRRHGDPLLMMSLFDKQIQLRMGQANMKRWIPDITPCLTDEDPLGVDDLATHRLPLAEASAAYGIFQRNVDGAVTIMLKPWG